MTLATAINVHDSVDAVNAEFYGRFPYPWPPMSFASLEDPGFEHAMLNQDLGDWTHSRIPETARVWVAGCGTNQAVYTALRFPRARILGSDLSARSLAICAETARVLEISHLALQQESLNDVEYVDAFDYIVCTGVLHHNADPLLTLRRIARALAPGGVIELMVYNYHHRLLPTAFQQALRHLAAAGATDFERLFTLARALIDSFPRESLMGSFLAEYQTCPDAMLADTLLQPVEHHYTVESLASLAADCGLSLLLPCINSYSAATGRTSWNMTFDRPDLIEAYDRLPDVARWHITNLMLLGKSPMLWFYLQKSDCPRQSEAEVCEDFLDTVFARCQTRQRVVVRSRDGQYRPSAVVRPHPAAPQHESIRRIVEAVDGRRTMRSILGELEGSVDFRKANEIRVKTTTSGFPHLRAVLAGRAEGSAASAH